MCRPPQPSGKGVSFCLPKPSRSECLRGTARLRAGVADAGCDALLVTNLTNVRYLTGFTGSAALLLVTPDDLVFVTDGRYRDQAAAQIEGAGVAAAPGEKALDPAWSSPETASS